MREVVNLPSEFVTEVKELRLQRKFVNKIINSWKKHKMRLARTESQMNSNIFSRVWKRSSIDNSNLSNYKGEYLKSMKEEPRSESMLNKSSSLNMIGHIMNQPDRKFFSGKSLKLAAESHKEMTENFKLGDACIVEQCYMLLGTKPEHNSLLISALQHLVNFEEPVSTST